jgi:hypothetical protein
MNLIEGGRPRIGCIGRQPSAGKLILSLEEGRPSMGKIVGSSRKIGKRRKKNTFERPSTKTGNSLAGGTRKHKDPGTPGKELRQERTTDLGRAKKRGMSKL